MTTGVRRRAVKERPTGTGRRDSPPGPRGQVVNGRRPKRVDFRAVNRAALKKLPAILRRWLPDGRRLGDEWVARNPTRRDRSHGSFKENVRNGVWADFATKDKGGHVISLLAYLSGETETAAALALAKMLEVGYD